MLDVPAAGTAGVAVARGPKSENPGFELAAVTGAVDFEAPDVVDFDPPAAPPVDFESRYPSFSAADLHAYWPCLVFPKYGSPSAW